MRLFWEFFTFELRFRFKSLSTYVYFLMWFLFAFFCVASESFGPVGGGNGKILLNSAFANTLDNILASVFGIIVIAAIFGTAMLRDFQRDTYQILFTKPISKFGYLGGRCHSGGLQGRGKGRGHPLSPTSPDLRKSAVRMPGTGGVADPVSGPSGCLQCSLSGSAGEEYG